MLELLVAVPVRLLPVARKRIRPPRPQVSADVLHQLRHGVRLLVELPEEGLVVDLGKRALGVAPQVVELGANRANDVARRLI
jgi:hypothetical protein